jgi:hypothetical protein
MRWRVFFPLCDLLLENWNRTTQEFSPLNTDDQLQIVVRLVEIGHQLNELQEGHPSNDSPEKYLKLIQERTKLRKRLALKNSKRRA